MAVNYNANYYRNRRYERQRLYNNVQRNTAKVQYAQQQMHNKNVQATERFIANARYQKFLNDLQTYQQAKAQADYYNAVQQQRYDEAVQEQEQTKNFSDYNNSSQINSLADILLNVGKWYGQPLGDTLKEIGSYINRTPISQAIQGNFSAALNNAITAFGEDVDIVANIAKAIIPNKHIASSDTSVTDANTWEKFKSVFGLSKTYGIGNRVNYDYDYDSWLANIAMETISDPLNLIEAVASFGASAVAKSGIKASLKDATTSAARKGLLKVGKEASEESLVRAANSAGKQIYKYAISDIKAPIKFKGQFKQGLKEFGEALITPMTKKNTFELGQYAKRASEVLDNQITITKNALAKGLATADDLAELELRKEILDVYRTAFNTNFSSNVVDNLSSLYKVADAIDKGIIRVAGIEAGVLPPYYIVRGLVKGGSSLAFAKQDFNKTLRAVNSELSLKDNIVQYKAYKRSKFESIPYNKTAYAYSALADKLEDVNAEEFFITNANKTVKDVKHTINSAMSLTLKGKDDQAIELLKTALRGQGIDPARRYGKYGFKVSNESYIKQYSDTIWKEIQDVLRQNDIMPGSKLWKSYENIHTTMCDAEVTLKKLLYKKYMTQASRNTMLPIIGESSDLFKKMINDITAADWDETMTANVIEDLELMTNTNMRMFIDISDEQDAYIRAHVGKEYYSAAESLPYLSVEQINKLKSSGELIGILTSKDSFTEADKYILNYYIDAFPELVDHYTREAIEGKFKDVEPVVLKEQIEAIEYSLNKFLDFTKNNPGVADESGRLVNNIISSLQELSDITDKPIAVVRHEADNIIINNKSKLSKLNKKLKVISAMLNKINFDDYYKTLPVDPVVLDTSYAENIAQLMTGSEKFNKRLNKFLKGEADEEEASQELLKIIRRRKKVLNTIWRTLSTYNYSYRDIEYFMDSIVELQQRLDILELSIYSKKELGTDFLTGYINLDNVVKDVDTKFKEVFKRFEDTPKRKAAETLPAPDVNIKSTVSPVDRPKLKARNDKLTYYRQHHINYNIKESMLTNVAASTESADKVLAPEAKELLNKLLFKDPDKTVDDYIQMVFDKEEAIKRNLKNSGERSNIKATKAFEDIDKEIESSVDITEDLRFALERVADPEQDIAASDLNTIYDSFNSFLKDDPITKKLRNEFYDYQEDALDKVMHELDEEVAASVSVYAVQLSQSYKTGALLHCLGFDDDAMQMGNIFSTLDYSGRIGSGSTTGFYDTVMEIHDHLPYYKKIYLSAQDQTTKFQDAFDPIYKQTLQLNLFSETRQAIIDHLKSNTLLTAFLPDENPEEAISIALDRMCNLYGKPINSLVGIEYEQLIDSTVTDICKYAIEKPVKGFMSVDEALEYIELYIKPQLKRTLSDIINTHYIIPCYEQGLEDLMFTPSIVDLHYNISSFLAFAETTNASGYSVVEESIYALKDNINQATATAHYFSDDVPVRETAAAVTEIDAFKMLEDYNHNLRETIAGLDTNNKAYWNTRVIQWSSIRSDGALYNHKIHTNQGWMRPDEAAEYLGLPKTTFSNNSAYALTHSQSSGMLTLKKLDLPLLWRPAKESREAYDLTKVYLDAAKVKGIDYTVEDVRNLYSLLDKFSSKTLDVNTLAIEALLKKNPDTFKSLSKLYGPMIELVKNYYPDFKYLPLLKKLLEVNPESPLRLNDDIGHYVVLNWLLNCVTAHNMAGFKPDFQSFKMYYLKQLVNDLTPEQLTIFINRRYLNDYVYTTANNSAIRSFLDFQGYGPKELTEDIKMELMHYEYGYEKELPTADIFGADSKSTAILDSYVKEIDKQYSDLIAHTNANKANRFELFRTEEYTKLQKIEQYIKQPWLLLSTLYNDSPGYMVLGFDSERSSIIKLMMENKKGLKEFNISYYVLPNNQIVIYINKKATLDGIEQTLSGRTKPQRYNAATYTNLPKRVAKDKAVKGHLITHRLANSQIICEYYNKLPKSLRDQMLINPNVLPTNTKGFTFSELHFDNTFIGDRINIQNIYGSPADDLEYRAKLLLSTVTSNMSTTKAAQILYANPDTSISVATVYSKLLNEGNTEEAAERMLLNMFKERKELTCLYWVQDGNRLVPKVVNIDTKSKLKTALQYKVNPIIVSKADAANFIKWSSRPAFRNSLSWEVLSTLSSCLKAGYLTSPGWVFRNFVSTLSKTILDTFDTGFNLSEIFDTFNRTRAEVQKYTELYASISDYGLSHKDLYTNSEGLQITNKLIKDFFNPDKNKNLTKEQLGFKDTFKFVHNWVTFGYADTMTQVLAQQERNGVIKGQHLIPALRNLDERLNKSIEYMFDVDGNVLPEYAKDYAKWQKTYGIHKTSTFLTDLAWKNPFTAMMLTANNDIETHARYFTYVWNLEHGKTISEATEHVRQVHFDYTSVSTLDQIANVVIPFINFKMNNTRYWIDMINKYPRLAAYIVHYYKANGYITASIEEKTEEESFMQQLLGGLMPIGGEGVYFKMGADYLDAITTAINPIEVLTDSTLGLRTAIAYIKNKRKLEEAVKELNDWQRIDDLYAQAEPYMKEEFRKSAEKRQEEKSYKLKSIQYYKDRQREIFLSLIPFYTRLKDYSPNDLNSAFSDLLASEPGTIESIEAATKAFPNTFGAFVDTHKQRYYYCYGNLNVSTTDYDKYLKAIESSMFEEDLHRKARPGWSGVTQDIIPKKEYYVLQNSIGAYYVTADPAKAIEALHGPNTPVNDNARYLAWGQKIDRETYGSTIYEDAVKQRKQLLTNKAKQKAKAVTKYGPQKYTHYLPYSTNRYNNSTYPRTQTQTRTYTQTRTQTKTSTADRMVYGYYRPAQARAIATARTRVRP